MYLWEFDARVAPPIAPPIALRIDAPRARQQSSERGRQAWSASAAARRFAAAGGAAERRSEAALRIGS